MVGEGAGGASVLPRDGEDWGVLDPRWSGIRSEWLDVRGLPVRVLRADGPDTGTPHLLVHGLGGSATNWLEVMGSFARRGAVVAPDLPGHGETEPPRPATAAVEPNAAFVAALAGALGWDRVNLAGNSMGGTIATLVAGERPDLVERLILLDPALPSAVRDLWRIPRMALLVVTPLAVPGLGERLIRRRYATREAAQLFDDLVAVVYGDPDRLRPPAREVAVANAARGQALPWRAPALAVAAESLVRLLLSRRRLLRAIDHVTAPTLLLWGDADRLVGRPVVEEVLRRRPDWEVHVLSGVGHVPMSEAPDEVLASVTTWLAGAGRAQPTAAADA